MLPTEVELYDPDIYVQGVPHKTFAQLRAEQPVYWHDKAEKDGRGFWAVTKHADVVRISKDPGTFSSHRAGTNIPDYPAEDLSSIQMMMLNMDPPQHGKFRKLVSVGFTPRMVALMEPKIRERVRAIVDNVADRGHCDFVRDISAELPLQVMAELLGVPMDEREKMFDWSNRLIGFDDPEFQTSMEDARVAAIEIWTYAQQMAEERRGRKGGEDLISVLANSMVDGESLTEADISGFFLLLVVAGNETTRNLTTGAMHALMEHPEQLARLRQDPTLIPTAVEEFLRWITPVMHFRRTATRDVELRGQRIREGDKVVLYYTSANRDEDVFQRPHEFDVGRKPNDHLAFGVGEHFCLGNSLARLEIRMIFEELLRRIPDMRLTGKVRRLRSNFINGIKEMPVEFTPERARRTA